MVVRAHQAIEFVPAASTDLTIREFRLPKTSGTHADVLAAVGLAWLAETILQESGVQVCSEGDEFRVVLPRDLTAADLDRASLTAGYSYLQVKRTDSPPIGMVDVVDYEAERDRARQFAELDQQARKLKTAGRPISDEESAHLQQLRPRPDWRRWQVLNTLQGDETTNKLIRHLAKLPPEQFRADVRQGIAALARGELSGLRWPVSLVQLFTPLAAKGYARLKPDGTGRGDKTKEQWADPFVEWLRYQGYFLAAAPYFHGPKREHIRLVTPLPGSIRVATYRAVVAELQRRPVYGGPPKLDVLSVIELARLLIERSVEYHLPDADPIASLFLSGVTPASVIAGITVTNYQSVSRQAKAVWSISSLALPGWFPIDSHRAAIEWLEILEEHRAVVRGLKDDHSDEISLLLAYRRFLEQRGEESALALLDFLGAYGPFLLRARESGRHVRQFTTDHVGRIVGAMSPPFTAILDDPGFQAVAAAVRRATVSAQAQKSMGQRDYREIRYDLLPDLRRKRLLPDDGALLETVADFVSKYNQENARRRETKQRAPSNVTTEQFRAFASLVEQHRAPLVGALLCAYGSCRQPREAEPGADAATDDDASASDQAETEENEE